MKRTGLKSLDFAFGPVGTLGGRGDVALVPKGMTVLGLTLGDMIVLNGGRVV